MELIQNTLSGNPQAQVILYEKYNKSVRNFLKKKYSVCYDLDDDVSEIMIKVFMNLENYDNTKSKFRSWVFSIAKNHMVDKWRNNSITLTGSNTNCVISYSTDMVDIGNNGSYVTSNTAALLEGSSFTTNCCSADYEFENCSSINLIVDQITPQDYTLLDMKYMQGYNYCEIGSEFNVSSSTISNRVNYIKTKLKKNNPDII
jgi:RNA polymerase sigma factor (sigma-70 family)